MLERLKQMIAHLTTVVPNWQIVFIQPEQAVVCTFLPEDIVHCKPVDPISWRHFHRFGITAVYNLHKIGTKILEICAEM